MKKKELNPNNISDILSKNIKDSNSIFVFPTDVVMHSWIDWIITHSEISGTDTVAFEQFTAWDNFKQDFVSAHIQGRAAVPSIFRKMFVTDIIARNGLKENKDERFQVIINPEDSYAKEADSFSDWIVKNLKSLNFWHKRICENKDEYGEFDKEDKDYDFLYNQYKKILDENNLFEPSWVDNLTISHNSKTFHIFYPEILEDFIDYSDVFAQADNVIIYTMPESVEKPKAYFYPDSRKELRHTILRIIKIVQNTKTDWSEIALSIPDMETYRPYIVREFELYGVPYVIKAGSSLTLNSPGRIFREIYDCYNNNFSFESLRTLVLDQCVPWKEEFAQIREDLIAQGNKMRCICSVDSDIWLSAFNGKIKSIENQLERGSFIYKTKEDLEEKLKFYSELKNFYLELYKAVSLFFPNDSEKNTFLNIRTSWINFKKRFLMDDSKFSEDANCILGRCIRELDEIIEIEKNYKCCNFIIPSPFKFYLQELDKKTYTKQTFNSGVNIFPYKLSGAGYFKYQFVIDCSQKNLDISYKRLTFLNNNKRKKLRLTDDDKMIKASEVFIKLYGKNTDCGDDFIHFSGSENTFNGFSIPHSEFSVLPYEEKNEYFKNLDKSDFILQADNFIKNAWFEKDNNNQNELQLNSMALESFNSWKQSCPCSSKKEKVNTKIINMINENLVGRRLVNYEKNKKIGVTSYKILDSKKNNYFITARDDLEKFFPCPRKWLFKSILKLHDDTLDTNLMQSFDMGILNHKILELFMNSFLNKRLPYYSCKENVFKIIPEKEGIINPEPIVYDEEIKNLFFGNDRIVLKAIKTTESLKDSPLVEKTLSSQESKIAESIIGFLKFLLKPYSISTGEEDPKNINGIGNCTLLGIEAPLYSSEENYNYFGKIDCFVLAPDNNIVIVDYKNTKGAIPPTKDSFPDENEIIHDFQMPVYYKLVKNNRKEDIAGCYYYAIKDNFSKSILDIYEEAQEEDNDEKSDNHNFNDTLEIIEKYSNEFKKHVEKNQFTPTQSNDKKDIFNVKNYHNCINCTFKAICRTTYNIAGKTIKEAKKGDENE